MNKRAIGRAAREKPSEKGTWDRDTKPTEKANWNNMPIPRQTDAETKAAECPKKIGGKMKRGKWKYPRSVCNGIQINDNTIFQS